MKLAMMEHLRVEGFRQGGDNLQSLGFRWFICESFVTLKYRFLPGYLNIYIYYSEQDMNYYQAELPAGWTGT